MWISRISIICITSICIIIALCFASSAQAKRNLTVVHERIRSINPKGKHSMRIINGEPAPAGDWPFMVSLQLYGSSHFCGGSILNDNTILTAGHCVVATLDEGFDATDVSVMIGSIHLSGGGQSIPVASAEYHHEFDINNLAAGRDIAVLKLAENINFDENDGSIGKVCLPNVDAQPATGGCIVMGWGNTESGVGGSGPDELLQTDVPMLTDQECLEIAGDFNSEDLLCAGGTPNDSCQGDSGGPYVCPVDDGAGNQYVQYGIVSYGQGCGENPGFYTKTAPFLEWLRERAES